ncbi:chemotaxis protein [Herbaspirillum robiniae]|uniref:Chemotaxis protein CheV n=1 Tax=Herbaspirillum robiniae TaxID=2014887 RepID=A0A246WNG1_9BURK|nr:chemotaxis protein [Herbaspirillum robiniae]NUU02606.1 chemotaxis protein CheV [Herbaspirillum robiniae]OWY27895.1 chemotaxis protein CheV [Herbaspirillum robiniae]
MDSFQQEIDERTNLTANNKFELLLFRLGSPAGDASGGDGELFGINVFKVREIVPALQITKPAGMRPPLMGMVNVRGQIMPVIDLPSIAGCTPSVEPGILLITEFARHTQAFAVRSVEDIARLDWTQVLPADASAASDVVTSIARLNTSDGKETLVQVLDVEHILELVSPSKENPAELAKAGGQIQLQPGAVVLAADDSRVARALIEGSLNELKLPFVMEKNGREAWDRLQALALEAEREGRSISSKVALILTDLEMPEMDGFTLTRRVKMHDKLKHIPVVIHSSLTGSANEDHVKTVGADGYIAKFSPPDFAAVVQKVLCASQ